MADIKCKQVPGMGKFAFYPLSKKGKDWFEDMKGAIPTKEDPFTDTKEGSAALTRKMVIDGLVINDAAETAQFKTGFDIKDVPPVVNINDVVITPYVVPDELNEWDTRRLHAGLVCWNRPEWFPSEWTEGRNRRGCE